MRPGRSEKCIVMACDDCDEADQIDQEISKVNNGRLRTYYGLFDLMENPPQERIVAAILATRADPETIGQTLQWMRHRWPRCPMTVVGDVGGQEHELAARENGANFLTRPVTSSQWRAIVDHATGRAVCGRVCGRREQPSTGRVTKQWPERRQVTSESGACDGSI